MDTSVRGLLLILAASCVLATTGCRPSDPAELLESARTHITKGDFPTAIINAKNALQADAKSAEARFLLGKAHFLAGDPAAAEDELRKAAAAGYRADDVAPLLAAALGQLGRNDQVITDFAQSNLVQVASHAELKTQVAMAYFAKGQLDDAARALEEVLQAAPDHEPASLLKARVSAARGDVAGALSMLDGILARPGASASAWLAKGDLLALAKAPNHAQAAEAYRKALDQKRDLLLAHVGLLRSTILLGQLDAARAHWTAMAKVFPGHAQTMFYDAMLALQIGNALHARDVSQNLLRMAPEAPQVLVLTARSELMLGNNGRAVALLTKASQLLPGSASLRYMLAEAHLRQNDTRRALTALAPSLGNDAVDVDALRLAGQAHLLSGDVKSAELMFARAAKLNPRDPQVQTAMALGRLRSGQAEAALGDLEAITRRGADTSADLALISERVRRGELDSASLAIDRLAGKTPQSAMPDFLRGRLALLRKDDAGARTHFEAALKKDASFLPAVDTLIALHSRSSQPAKAKDLLYGLLATQPNDAQLIVRLADLIGRSGGASGEVLRLLERAVAAQPADLGARIALVDFLQRSGDGQRAVAAASEALVQVQDSPELLERLGMLQHQQGEPQAALATLGKLAALQPNSPIAYVRLAEVRTAEGNFDGARSDLDRAMSLAPGSIEIKRTAVRLAMQAQRPEQALALARGLQARQPTDALGYVLEGSVLMTQKDARNAEVAYQKALSKRGGAEAAPGLYRALIAQNRIPDADRMAQAWLKNNPSDTAFIFHLGVMAEQMNKPDVAEQRYRAVLERNPDHPPTLNNLAHLLAQQKKPGAAAFAERAVALAPALAAAHDTLASSYAASGRMADALKAQSRAVELAPGSGDLRLNLAKLYVQTGDKDRARDELGRLAQLGGRFAAQNEVTRLQQELGAGPAADTTGKR